MATNGCFWNYWTFWSCKQLQPLLKTASLLLFWTTYHGAGTQKPFPPYWREPKGLMWLPEAIFCCSLFPGLPHHQQPHCHPCHIILQWPSNTNDGRKATYPSLSLCSRSVCMQNRIMQSHPTHNLIYAFPVAHLVQNGFHLLADFAEQFLQPAERAAQAHNRAQRILTSGLGCGNEKAFSLSSFFPEASCWSSCWKLWQEWQLKDQSSPTLATAPGPSLQRGSKTPAVLAPKLTNDTW